MITIKSDIIALRGAVDSMQGGRSENQDDFGFIDTPLGFLLIVCDGMGGGPGGKMASSAVKNKFAAVICSSSPDTPKDYALKKATNDANEVLEQLMRDNHALVGMGSTFVAILVDKKSAFIANAGDSRCYLLRNKKVIFRSHDHSLVAELVRSKALTEEEARVSPQSNVITRGLGSTANHVPEIYEVAFKKGDRFVVCTDGVWGCMPEKDLIIRFGSKDELSNMVTSLSSEIDRIGYAKGGGHDNHTLAVIDIEEDSIDKKSHLNIPRKYYVWIAVAGAVIAIIVSLLLLKKDSWTSDINLRNTPGYTQPSSNYDESGKTNEDKRETMDAPNDTEKADVASDQGKEATSGSIPDGETSQKIKEGLSKLKKQEDASAAQPDDNEKEKGTDSTHGNVKNNAPKESAAAGITAEQRTIIIEKIISKLDSIKNVKIEKEVSNAGSKFNTSITTGLERIHELIAEYKKAAKSDKDPEAISTTKKIVNNTNGWIYQKDSKGNYILDKNKRAAIQICIDSLRVLNENLRQDN